MSDIYTPQKLYRIARFCQGLNFTKSSSVLFSRFLKQRIRTETQLNRNSTDLELRFLYLRKVDRTSHLKQTTKVLSFSLRHLLPGIFSSPLWQTCSLRRSVEFICKIYGPAFPFKRRLLLLELVLKIASILRLFRKRHVCSNLLLLCTCC